MPHVTRANRWFEMHRWLPENPCCEVNYVRRLAALTVPVFMVHPQPQDIPASVAYPKEKILDFVYGVVKDRHGRERPARFNPNDFGSTLSWMLAMAIVELADEPGQNEIGLWGVDMAAGEEYGPQKDGCLSLLHIAKSIGIRVALPPESDLIRPAPLYGYQEHDHFWIKLREREKEVEARAADARRRAQAAIEETCFLEGALDCTRYDMKTWVGDAQALRMAYGQPGVIEGTAVEVIPDAVKTAVPAITASEKPAPKKRGRKPKPKDVQAPLEPPKPRIRAINPNDKRLKANRVPVKAIPNGRWNPNPEPAYEMPA